MEISIDIKTSNEEDMLKARELVLRMTKIVNSIKVDSFEINVNQEDRKNKEEC